MRSENMALAEFRGSVLVYSLTPLSNAQKNPGNLHPLTGLTLFSDAGRKTIINQFVLN